MSRAVEMVHWMGHGEEATWSMLLRFLATTPRSASQIARELGERSHETIPDAYVIWIFGEDVDKSS